MDQGGFQSVCDCKDGTLIPTNALVKNEAAYLDRHGNYSINSLMICWPDMKFYYVSASCRGAAHDFSFYNDYILSE